jgi:hypothetical protein
MISQEDIIKRIESDFKDLADKATEIIEDAVSKTDYLKTNRVIRCIIYLANGDLTQLHKYIDKAVYDPRDVMLWAEYEKPSEEHLGKRIRDFNKTFDRCTEDVNQ